MMNFRQRRNRALRRGIERSLPSGAPPASWLGVQPLEPRLLLSAVVETSHVFAVGGAAGDQFGQSVDVSGDLMIVGASGRDTAGNNAGAAQIFTRNGNNWNLMVTLTASDAGPGDLFGTAVAIDGNLAVVTAAGDDAGAGASSGSAYVFQRNGNAWVQVAKLAAGDGGAGDQFGVAADISGNRVIIGAFQDDDLANNTGSAYIFQDDGLGFTQTAKLLGDASAFAEFGSSVSLSGDYAIVGAHGDSNASGSNAGAAFIYNFNGNVWQRQAKLKSSDMVAFDQFGVSVAIDGNMAVIGSSQNDDNGSASGSAYVFERSGNSWSQKAKLVAPDAAAGDQFGRSVAVSGDHIAVGAHTDNLNNLVLDSGSVYIFGRSGNQWLNESQLIASDGKSEDQLGRAVAIDGVFAVGGANFDDTSAGVDAGSVYVLQIGSGGPIQAAPVTATLIGDLLQITGTDNDDVINVNAVSNGRVRVTGSGIDQEFDLVNNITINALAGNDTITIGNNVRDIAGNLIGVVINGGDGNDVINGGQGDDVIDGGAGNDTVDGGAGDDTVDGGLGDDVIVGGTGVNTLTGGGGIDSIDGVTAGPQVILGDNRPKKVTYVDADGTAVTLSFKGTGTATITFGGTNVGQSSAKGGIAVTGDNLTIDTIALTDTEIRSGITIAARGGDGLATIGQITGSTLLGTITGKTVDLIGNGIVLTGAGAVGKVMLHDLLNGADIRASGSDITKGVSIKLNEFGAGSSIELGSNLGMLNGVGDFLGEVSAPTIKTVRTKGNLGGTFNATGVDAAGVSIGILGGAASNASVTAAGGVKSILVNSWDSGNIEAAWIGRLFSKGAMDADVNLTGADAKGISLGLLKALTITDLDLTAPGIVKSIIVNDWLDGAITAESIGRVTAKNDFNADVTLTGVDTKGVSLGMLKAATITDIDLTAPGIVKSITVNDRLDGAITAGSVGRLGAKNDFAADLTLTDDTQAKTLGNAAINGALRDAVWSIDGPVGAINAGSTNDNLRVDVLGTLASLNVKGNAGGQFAADHFLRVAVGGDLTDAHFLAGAHLGDDGQVGGIGADADTFAGGTIGSFSVRGQTTNSIIGAGLDPVDGEFNNGNDTVIGGVDSSIKSLALGGTVDGTSLFAAGLFPTRIVIDGAIIDPATDPRFLLA